MSYRGMATLGVFGRLKCLGILEWYLVNVDHASSTLLTLKSI